jgi:hypothetical protein
VGRRWYRQQRNRPLLRGGATGPCSGGLSRRWATPSHHNRARPPAHATDEPCQEVVTVTTQHNNDRPPKTTKEVIARPIDPEGTTLLERELR